MKVDDFLRLVEERLEISPGTLQMTSELDSLDQWDSLGQLGFVALIDEKFQIPVSMEKLRNCSNVNDLLLLLREKLTE